VLYGINVTVTLETCILNMTPLCWDTTALGRVLQVADEALREETPRGCVE
jgi:hypothetical protein